MSVARRAVFVAGIIIAVGGKALANDLEHRMKRRWRVILLWIMVQELG